MLLLAFLDSPSVFFLLAIALWLEYSVVDCTFHRLPVAGLCPVPFPFFVHGRPLYFHLHGTEWNGVFVATVSRKGIIEERWWKWYWWRRISKWYTLTGAVSEESYDSDCVTESRPESDLPLVTHAVMLKCIGARGEEYSSWGMQQASKRVYCTSQTQSWTTQCEGLRGNCFPMRTWQKMDSNWICHEGATRCTYSIYTCTCSFLWIQYIRSGSTAILQTLYFQNCDWDPIVSQYRSTHWSGQ